MAKKDSFEVAVRRELEKKIALEDGSTMTKREILAEKFVNQCINDKGPVDKKLLELLLQREWPVIKQVSQKVETKEAHGVTPFFSETEIRTHDRVERVAKETEH